MTLSSPSENPANLQRITCPICPLHCDDLTISVSEGNPRVTGCGHAADAFRNHSVSRGSVPDTLQKAGSVAVIVGGVDFETARSLTRLHSLGRIALFCDSDATLAALDITTRRDGNISCTMAETRQRATTVWTVGQTNLSWPRFAERVDLKSIQSRGGQVFHDDSVGIDTLPARLDRLNEGDSVHIWIGPQAFPRAEADIVAALLGRWVREQNQQRRVFLNTFQYAVTLQSLALWRTNQPIPVVDSTINDFDLRLGISMNVMPSKSITLNGFVGHQDPGPDQADWFAASQIPGWHHRSQIVRGDGSVTLPLKTVSQPPRSRDSLPRMSEWLTQWFDA
ncbi:MAG: hypothetical protein AAF539_01225 [Planctomycetota bacterium]